MLRLPLSRRRSGAHRCCCGYAGGLLRQRLQYVQDVEHQRHHVNLFTTHPDNGCDHFLARCRQTTADITDFLYQVAADVRCRVLPDAGDIVCAGRHTVIALGDLLNTAGQKTGSAQYGGLVRGLYRGVAGTSVRFSLSAVISRCWALSRID
ncbi:hypothetical protein SGGMMB4_05922 [Sodalis glossinidius str. 'morsitans']|uniref:Uncharacterized protein n=1 Tax=Sodalis glossinidius (strain morsitans) TaxID=343509 RepID=Q2NWF1_SODGM|nr:hypothetical protein SG0249 [Sodalis glossinidius str. 'morsitans']CRL43895.1 hypothetical protein SGGMMB4_05922 [Sodalis glossinidius str. 'morsitans']